MSPVPANRRERYRAEIRDEVKRLALGQLAESGPCGLSLNAIARQMGVTGPALYRYFAGRDELLVELVVDAYEDLADMVHAAAHPTGARPPQDRVRAVAAAYREWALSQPHRYRLLFGATVPTDRVPADRIAPAAGRTRAALLDALSALVPSSGPAGNSADGPANGPAVRLSRLATAAWTRWHGVLSLQIGGQFDSVGIDPAVLFWAEVDALLAAAVPGTDRG
ncbi:MAG TPA: TetR/AcrR family transcriptional regulator [Mycobacteriales bacterium]